MHRSGRQYRDRAGGTHQRGPHAAQRSRCEQTPAELSLGWYNTDVTITWLCIDTVAGQSTVSRTVSTEGANQTVSATCTDLAGNTAIRQSDREYR